MNNGDDESYQEIVTIMCLAGTGCNAAYLETLENVDKWDGEKDYPNQVRALRLVKLAVAMSSPKTIHLLITIGSDRYRVGSLWRQRQFRLH